MIVALIGQKGGSGKTTTSLNIACEWTRLGHRVLLVDADPQGSSCTFGDLANELGTKCPTVVAMGTGLHKPDQLPALAEHFDRVVIDCPPRHGVLQKSALMVCDLAIVPCGQSGVDAWALSETLELIESAEVVRPQLHSRMLITRKMTNTTLGQQARQYLEDEGLSVMKTELGFRVAYQESPAAGQGVTTYEPSSKASDEVKALVSEIEELLEGKEVANVA